MGGLRQARRIGLIAVLVAAALSGGTLSASADEWGTNDSSTGAHPDSDPHTYCYSSSVGSDATSGIYEAEWSAMDPTEVNVDYQSSCDLSSGSETDVVWRQANLSGTIRGETYCEDFDTYCDQYYVTLDLPEINEGANDEADESKTACHELGHSGGLSHGGTTDCMLSGEIPSTATQYQRYNAHHRDHLNAWF